MPKKGQTYWTKARREADPEGWAQEQASRRAAKNAIQAQYYAKNKDAVNAHKAKYRAKNKDKVKAHMAKWNAKKAVFIKKLSENARKRHIKKGFPAESFALTPPFIEALCAKQNGQCFYTYVVLEFAPNKDGTASPDRIDNSRGYEADNVVLTTTAWNIVRKDRSIEDTLATLGALSVGLSSRKDSSASIVNRAKASRKKPKRETAEVLPLFSANETKKESA